MLEKLENSKWELSSFHKATEGLPLFWGVYALECNHNGKRYIGSTAGIRGIRGRIKQHWNNLKRGEHSSPYMQRTFNKVGAAGFSVVILCVTSREDSLIEEQKFLDATQVYLPRYGFNTQRIACAKPVLRPIRERLKPEQRGKPFKLLYRGEVFEGRNLVLFCRVRGLNASLLCQVLKGNRKQWRGWTRPEDPKRSHKFLAPSGEVFETTHLTEFADAHGLNRRCLNRLALGQRDTHSGWRLAG